MIFIKCKTTDQMAEICKQIDDKYRNSEFPTRTQTEEAFGKMFEEMLGDLKGMICWIGLAAVVISLLCVAGNSMAMSMRERTTEVAVFKAIGFNKGLVLFLVMAESVLVAGLGGALGSLGCKALCELVDLSQYTAGFLPFFYVPWNVALEGLAVSLLHRAGQRGDSGGAGGQSLGRRRPPEGHLSRHDSAQIQPPQPPGPLEDDPDDRAGHGPGRLVVVHPLRPRRWAGA